MRINWMMEGDVEVDDEQIALAKAWGWVPNGIDDAETLIDLLGIKLSDHVTFSRFNLEES